MNLDVETARTYLTEARQAYHQLMLGKNVVSVRDQNGERIEFNMTRKSDLQQYIAQLEQIIGSSDPGPMEVIL